MTAEPPGSRTRDALLLVLTALAGWLDALAYTELGSVFVSFQSGNVIFAGFAIDQADDGLLVRAVVSVAAFLAGAAVGSAVAGTAARGQAWPRRLSHALALEWVLLLAVAVVWVVTGKPADHEGARVAIVALAAAAMGVQGASVLIFKLPGVATNRLTGTLTTLADHLVHRAHVARAKPSATYLALLCASYAGSAFVVATLHGAPALAVVPVAALAVVLAIGHARSLAAERRAAE